jgi:hypothetical protein
MRSKIERPYSKLKDGKPSQASGRGRNSDLLSDINVIGVDDNFPVSFVNLWPLQRAAIKPFGQIAEGITWLHGVVHRLNRQSRRLVSDHDRLGFVQTINKSRIIQFFDK